MKKNLEEIRFFGGKLQLTSHALIKLKGDDCVNFLHSQGTNDFSSLAENQGQLNCRLDISAKIHSFFYAAKVGGGVAIVVANEIKQKLIDELNKFIIMENVEIEVADSEHINIICSPFTKEIAAELGDKSSYFVGKYLGEEALFLWGDNSLLYDQVNLSEMTDEIINYLNLLSGWPCWNKSLETKLVNETTLNDLAISYTKGCFLGQETAAKINNNRGAAYYPSMLITKENIVADLIENKTFKINESKAGHINKVLKLEDKTVLLVDLFRDYRVENARYSIDLDRNSITVEVVSFPFFKAKSREEKAAEFFEKAVEGYQQNKLEEAVSLLEHSLELNPKFPDALEVFGVIKGHQGKYQEALDLMDKLLVVDPDSVMAHTNKSLFYMKMGRIEDAETEKSLATSKSFEKLDKNSLEKDIQSKERKAKEEGLLKREQMFREVLEIDSEDPLANFGIGEISFHRKMYHETVEYIDKVLAAEPNNAKAYLLKGKALEELGDKGQAKVVFDHGYKIASKNGQNTEANEMYKRLSSL